MIALNFKTLNFKTTTP